jgi:hypothetical protein
MSLLPYYHSFCIEQGSFSGYGDTGLQLIKTSYGTITHIQVNSFRDSPVPATRQVLTGIGPAEHSGSPAYLHVFHRGYPDLGSFAHFWGSMLVSFLPVRYGRDSGFLRATTLLKKTTEPVWMAYSSIMIISPVIDRAEPSPPVR